MKQLLFIAFIPFLCNAQIKNLPTSAETHKDWMKIVIVRDTTDLSKMFKIGLIWSSNTYPSRDKDLHSIKKKSSKMGAQLAYLKESEGKWIAIAYAENEQEARFPDEKIKDLRHFSEIETNRHFSKSFDKNGGFYRIWLDYRKYIGKMKLNNGKYDVFTIKDEYIWTIPE